MTLLKVDEYLLFCQKITEYLWLSIKNKYLRGYDSLINAESVRYGSTPNLLKLLLSASLTYSVMFSFMI
ncbi:Uncharacterised protein [Legionella israelensis]|uniref:Uncharacterized protein n=1 Tax=Legionella israelensis TaxID=454 RepID=A0A0W0W1D5_9GAMM|nr:hypothetical protein Lisr_1187 [Legionella israelensis]SCY52978.1 hypothetical protein SAMN02746069_02764 [Legionella israelensis DSM 19235]STX57839.1 Uncharacterised protein [Legionella israelensis]